MSSNVDYFVLFLYLCSLGYPEEQTDEIKKIADNEKILLKKIFKKDIYDSSLPSDSPTIIVPVMFIDHIEKLDQKQQYMIMHCSMLFHWTDSRIVWEPRDYGNVLKIVRHKSDLSRMWFPAIHFTELKLRGDQAMQYYNTEVTLTSTGAVFAQVALTLKSTCSFDFSDFPNDIQSCLLTMFTPLPMSRLKFSRWTSLARRSDIFGNAQNEKLAVRAGDFILSGLSVIPLYILPFGKITANQSADRPDVMRSVIRFELRFKRISHLYTLTIALPLFCLATVTYMSATVSTPTSSVIWLLLCTSAQFVNYSLMLDKLPPDQLNTPLCARIAALLLLETLLLLLYRVAMAYRQTHCIKDLNSIMMTNTVENGLRIFLSLHVLVNIYLLFC